MTEPRKKADSPIVAAVVVACLFILAGALGVYTWGYFATSWSLAGDGVTLRIFSRNWQLELFEPAAPVESLLTRTEVKAFSLDLDPPRHIFP